jgi:NTE family protein
MAPALCPLEISPFDFSASGELIERAMRSTKRWIDAGGLVRQARSRELSAHHH